MCIRDRVSTQSTGSLPGALAGPSTMVFTTIEITFVSFAVVLLTILFLLLLRGGFFSLPANPAALPDTQRDFERELRQQKAQKKQAKKAEKIKAQAKAYNYEPVVPQAPKKKEKEYATVLNFNSKVDAPTKPKVAKAKAAVKPEAKVNKVNKTETPTTTTTTTTPVSAAPKRRVGVQFAEGDKRENVTRTTEPRQPRAPVEKKEREPPRIICYNCGHLGHTSKECPSAKETLICFSCGELGHFSKDCTEKSKRHFFRFSVL
eukprot:TRINITY_DN502_c0_g1_i2.p1 TRINITY_DN502_c0_g1~~TRINITY_DN502_c0_g1_i2.p1  ORF type:complete len:261 (-),score=86.94 TRINITY_DN502_c0_g1_i2:406-1188(-)